MVFIDRWLCSNERKKERKKEKEDMIYERTE
jgi:hypothetical protein